ncbi:MAG: hypothetical protein IPJ29_15335 [Chitinophagaceae bacterium]|nr:hypothetical protein [Chitinophagaceae bacterium]
MPKIAWKTGTSYGKKDAWSIGYNKNFTVGVWTGNFSGIGAADLSGANIATPLLFKIFNTIDYDSDEEWFTTARRLRHTTGMQRNRHGSFRTLYQFGYGLFYSAYFVRQSLRQPAGSNDKS